MPTERGYGWKRRMGRGEREARCNEKSTFLCQHEDQDSASNKDLLIFLFVCLARITSCFSPKRPFGEIWNNINNAKWHTNTRKLDCMNVLVCLYEWVGGQWAAWPVSAYYISYIEKDINVIVVDFWRSVYLRLPSSNNNNNKHTYSNDNETSIHIYIFLAYWHK